jgi:hypothetical protein
MDEMEIETEAGRKPEMTKEEFSSKMVDDFTHAICNCYNLVNGFLPYGHWQETRKKVEPFLKEMMEKPKQ